MDRPHLKGRLILVVEDQPLIAFDTAQVFEQAGAVVWTAHNLNEAFEVIRTEPLSAAILDHGLPDGDSSELCARLKERASPFFIYSGYRNATGACGDALQISKPAADGTLVTAMERLIRDAKPTQLHS